MRAPEEAFDPITLVGSQANLREQLAEMLGLRPEPPRSDLHVRVVGTETHGQVVVEKLHFQPVPGLYYTANFYLPVQRTGPLPTVLYLCGHWNFVSNGISYGNKVRYQRNGLTFAENGFACLVLDTFQWGEIPAEHRGTTRQGAWWWNCVGFTPAGVEAWAGIRALDYLCMRPEVDTNRIGVTGHSGGGAYSWMVAALDERVRAAAPLAGLADLEAHILNGLIDSHCDCNFPVNLYRWDFTVLPALLAPRPLLIGGTDSDPIFPMETTLRIYRHARVVYGLFSAETNLGLVIGPGIHDETPELRTAALNWFNRYLKGRPGAPARLFFDSPLPPERLRVLERAPDRFINTNLGAHFNPPVRPVLPDLETLRARLCELVFRGWPPDPPVPRITAIRSGTAPGIGCSLVVIDFESQDYVPLRMYMLVRVGAGPGAAPALHVLSHPEWRKWVRPMLQLFPGLVQEEASILAGEQNQGSEEISLCTALAESDCIILLAPRGIGPGKWTDDIRVLDRIRRRFMALGQTLDGMRVWDVRAGMCALRNVVPGLPGKLRVHASGTMAVNALYAAVFEDAIGELTLSDVPESHKTGPDYINVLKVVDIPDVIALLRRAGVEIHHPSKAKRTGTEPPGV